QLGGPQHGAVAAEDQHDLRALGAPRPPLDDPRPEVLRQVGGDDLGPLLLDGAQPDAVLGQLGRDIGGGAQVGRAPRVQDGQHLAGHDGPVSTAWDKASSPTSLPSRRRQRKNSTLPDGPGNGLATAPASRRPSPRAAATTSRNAASRNAGSRTTPPAPNRCLPTSNCGFTIGSSTPSVHAASAGSTVRSEMNDRSATVSWAGPPISAGVSARTLVRSCTRTRASLRSRQTSCPYPTSTAMTSRAPRSSSTSVKPPVEAPASRQRRPAGSISRASSAPISLWAPREAHCRSAVSTTMTGVSRSTTVAAFSAVMPRTVTRPCSISSAACPRERAMPRRTSSASSRALVTTPPSLLA